MWENMNKLKAYVFDLVRRLFWDDYDPNEDFNCCYCGKPVFHRYLFCSIKCTDKFEQRYKN